ncbi:hypothetical protein AVEN_91967-1 [Araneus ventricosus]|uniref:Uncharacterized protein n=1 Tax=Araneus ventricosus TaxID=182803 RepID=A0A4Y2VUC0_ARAVE|nr:hypothetical protein AVEN_9481-1 [Araneus ventricosus]GBO27877.1 hypothetical protein AVEN_91967-1 [Araneus ventricosus]
MKSPPQRGIPSELFIPHRLKQDNFRLPPQLGTPESAQHPRYCPFPSDTLGHHGKSLPSNAGLMVGKRVLQGEAWSDLSDSRGTHDLGDKLGDLGDK